MSYGASVSFDDALEFVLEREGGGALTDDPQDPGGLTRWGISHRAHPDVNIRELTRSHAAEIYHRDYWVRCRCSELPPRLALLVFDAAVNQGAGSAIEMLQSALGVTPDGIIGKNTLRAVSSLSWEPVAVDFQAFRILRYARNPRWSRYGLGWTLRVLEGYRVALEQK